MMITSMVDFMEKECSVLIVAFGPSNLDRMKQADPITLECVSEGGALRPPAFPNHLSVIVAYEEDDRVLYELAKRKDVAGILKYLERGRTWNPETDGLDKTEYLKRLYEKPGDGR